MRRICRTQLRGLGQQQNRATSSYLRPPVPASRCAKAASTAEVSAKKKSKVGSPKSKVRQVDLGRLTSDVGLVFWLWHKNYKLIDGSSWRPQVWRCLESSWFIAPQQS